MDERPRVHAIMLQKRPQSQDGASRLLRGTAAFSGHLLPSYRGEQGTVPMIGGHSLITGKGAWLCCLRAISPAA